MKRILSTCLFISFSVLFFGCPSQNNIKPSPVEPPDAVWCTPGCKHLLMLTGRDGNPGCEEARVIAMPNGDIITCEQFCRDTLQAGRNLYPSCFVKVKECSEIEEYRKRSEPCEGR